MLKTLFTTTVAGAMALAVGIAAPTTSDAAKFDITYTGIVPSPGETVDYRFNSSNGAASAGAFQMTATDQGQDADLIGNFLAWCFDLTGTISSAASNNPYEFEAKDFLSTGALGRVQSVFDAGYDAALNATGTTNQIRETRAGFQVAIWEAIYDGLDSTGLDTNNGTFSLRNAGSDDKARIKTAAAGFLDDANSYSGSQQWIITQLAATDLDVQDLGTATVIPLPAAAWLLMAVSGGLIAAKRRHARRGA